MRNTANVYCGGFLASEYQKTITSIAAVFAAVGALFAIFPVMGEATLNDMRRYLEQSGVGEQFRRALAAAPAVQTSKEYQQGMGRFEKAVGHLPREAFVMAADKTAVAPLQPDPAVKGFDFSSLFRNISEATLREVLIRQNFLDYDDGSKKIRETAKGFKSLKESFGKDAVKKVYPPPWSNEKPMSKQELHDEKMRKTFNENIKPMPHAPKLNIPSFNVPFMWDLIELQLKLNGYPPQVPDEDSFT